MTSRERVYRALTFGCPDRLPVYSHCPEDGSDIAVLRWNEVIPEGDWPDGQQPLFDHWHCGWTRGTRDGPAGVSIHPLKHWEDFDAFPWPDPDDPGLYAGMAAGLLGLGERFVLTHIFMLLLGRMQGLRGFSNALVDLRRHPCKAADLADRIVDFHLGVMKNIEGLFPGQVDGLAFCDDWGTDGGPMVSPALWRGFFAPRYRRIFDACRDYGWKIFMESRGRVNDILGDLIELGVDAISLPHPLAMGIDETGGAYRGKICFAACCDRDRTLPGGGREEIRAEVRQLLEKWATPAGGYILALGGDGGAGIPPEKKQWIVDAYREFDPWRAR